MTQLTRDDVLKLARLSRLALTDEEVDEFLQELSSVLQYVEQLKDVDVAGLAPTSQVTGLTNVMRDDTVQDYGIVRDDLLRLAPATQDDQLKVKRMIG
ncbi:MAG TPA: Asp-tRNA(Asn)/Glu-tRNA(Gln) amidotransferase subunit GatC [Candidatus Saccharimonadales bacterium]|nr:Asp-tRNA(Asn)/Glu-tRNA(Gln) amidotransferase subunit GatC [Candidatus Saccharimonadales bacterium]